MEIADVAKVCYEANRAYCQSLGDDSFDPWEEAPDWQRLTNVNGVRFRLSNPGCGALEMHNSWMEQKIREGWVHGETKNTQTKEHPCLLPYDQLPPEQKVKDSLFSAIVDALKHLI